MGITTMAADIPIKSFKVKIKDSNQYLKKGGNPFGVTTTWQQGTTDAEDLTTLNHLHLDTSTGDQRKIFISTASESDNWTLDGNILKYDDNGTTRYLGPNDVYGQVHLTNQAGAVQIELVSDG